MRRRSSYSINPRAERPYVAPFLNVAFTYYAAKCIRFVNGVRNRVPTILDNSHDSKVCFGILENEFIPDGTNVKNFPIYLKQSV